MIKKGIAKVAAAAVPIAAIAVGLTPSAASAATTGSWTAHYNCGLGVDMQVHYLRDTTNNLVRMDGWALYEADKSKAMYHMDQDVVSTTSKLHYKSDTPVAARRDSRTGVPISQNNAPWLRPGEGVVIISVHLMWGKLDMGTTCPAVRLN